MRRRSASGELSHSTVRAISQRSCASSPILAAAAMASRATTRRVVGIAGAPAFERNGAEPVMQAGKVGARLAPAPQAAATRSRPSQASRSSGAIVSHASSRIAASSVAGKARVSSEREPFAEPGVLVPVRIVHERIPLPPRLLNTVVGDGAVRPAPLRGDCGEGIGEKRVVGDPRRPRSRRGLRRRRPRRDPLPRWTSPLAASLARFPGPAPQTREPRVAERPVRFGGGDPPAGAERRVGPDEIVGGMADVPLSIVQHEILDMDRKTFQPQRGAGVGEVGPLDPAVADRALGEPFVETGEQILGIRKRHGEFAPVEFDHCHGARAGHRSSLATVAPACSSRSRVCGIPASDASKGFLQIFRK